MFAQPFYIVDSFLYNNVIIAWANDKAMKGLLAWIVDNIVASSIMGSNCNSSFSMLYGLNECKEF
jgi:hypothetical protein